RAERKAKIQGKIDDLHGKLQNKVEQAKQRSAQLKSETDAKVQALKKKAASARAEHKAAINKQITDIVNQFEQAATEFRADAVVGLRKEADALEKAG
ncbi:MAG TPA: hypothetical protein VIX37_13400, partial [Candidatus Sulfotelmatobacter sp.]